MLARLSRAAGMPNPLSEQSLQVKAAGVVAGVGALAQAPTGPRGRRDDRDSRSCAPVRSCRGVEVEVAVILSSCGRFHSSVEVVIASDGDAKYAHGELLGVPPRKPSRSARRRCRGCRTENEGGIDVYRREVTCLTRYSTPTVLTTVRRDITSALRACSCDHRRDRKSQFLR